MNKSDTLNKIVKLAISHDLDPDWQDLSKEEKSQIKKMARRTAKTAVDQMCFEYEAWGQYSETNWLCLVSATLSALRKYRETL
jgi:hypothetical protein